LLYLSVEKTVFDNFRAVDFSKERPLKQTSAYGI
jgi:hypothetical protein